ncbi:MAG: hypothetical protein QM607_03230 [Microbacterium sp.]
MTNSSLNAASGLSFHDERTMVRVVHSLLRGAIRRQMWMLMLDDERTLLPPLMPCSDMPDVPSGDDADSCISVFDDMLNDVGAAALVVVWEREGGPAPRPWELAWASAFHEAAQQVDAPLHAQLLLHDTGVRLLTPADFQAKAA